MLRNLSAAIYGTITVGSVLAVESAARETYLATAGGVAVALVLLWLAHSYAEDAARRVHGEEPLTVEGLLHEMRDEAAILLGASIPLLAFAIAGATGAALTTAVNVGVWTSAGAVPLVELAAGLRAKLDGHELVLQTLLGTLLGVGIVGLKFVLHP